MRTQDCTSFWHLDDSLEGAVLDGHLWPVPASAAHDFALYLDEPLAWALGVHPSRKPNPEALALRVAALRESVWETMAAHDIPELHKAVPFAVNGRSEPTDWRFVAIVRQEGAFWLTVIRARNPEPTKPDGISVGGRPTAPRFSLAPP